MKTPVFLVALLMASLATSSVGETPGRGKPEARPPASTCPADDRVAGFALRAFIDPQTGQLREPTPEEVRALARTAREKFVRELETLEEVVHPDGMISLDLKDVAVATGAACSSGAIEPSPVLLALGMGEQRARGSIRWSLSKLTTAEDIEYVLSVVPEAVARLREISPTWRNRRTFSGRRRTRSVPSTC